MRGIGDTRVSVKIRLMSCNACNLRPLRMTLAFSAIAACGAVWLIKNLGKLGPYLWLNHEISDCVVEQ